MSISSERIVWIDCEMTGLDVNRDALVEVGVLVTDADLNILGEGVQLVIKPGDEASEGALENMDDFVVNMHKSSGLLEDIPHGVSMAEAEEAVLAYVKKYVPVSGKAQLGGNSVGMDKRFLEKYMPAVMGHLHYRVIDVSTIKELAARWFPAARFAAPAKTGNHRALGDIRDSIDELKYYRRAIFVPEGPDSTAAAAIARQVSAERQALPGDEA
ncbi:MAG: oligoribonuclease [Rothia sp. (in: high G+C Gram-positive bacteria)]|uniref:oligoribonuclease n=1 Tax=Rothia sp. (in: high G+C Gram-positive bacteria) TaxID=1885016 RepID=UPI0026DFC48E|nr:oligoribonuclease [Rothia sp. (in: high G+C Gram-positive bacteria)]MDO5750841.1 oligoribonuclease [Rothia sp. (in: high G+C Gram-positive bacteria)]